MVSIIIISIIIISSIIIIRILVVYIIDRGGRTIAATPVISR